MPVLALTWPWPYPRLRGFWENVPCLHLKKKKFRWRLAPAHWFHSSCQEQSTLAQPAGKAVTKCSLTSCVWGRFMISFHSMPGQRHSQPSPTSLGCSHVHLEIHLFKQRKCALFSFVPANCLPWESNLISHQKVDNCSCTSSIKLVIHNTMTVWPDLYFSKTMAA